MRHQDSIENINYDTSLIGENVIGFNKLDGTNLVARYNVRTKSFPAYGTRKMIIDETHPDFGVGINLIKNIEPELIKLVEENRGKKGVFNGVEEIHFYFEFGGKQSFAGFHHPEDEKEVVLTSVFLKKRGYLEPKNFISIFDNNNSIKIPEILYRGVLTKEIINQIQQTLEVKEESFSDFREGVVFYRTTLKKGQQLPRIKVKTAWWINKLKNKYPEQFQELL